MRLDYSEPFEEAYYALEHAIKYLKDESYPGKDDTAELEYYTKLLNLCEEVSRNYVV